MAGGDLEGGEMGVLEVGVGVKLKWEVKLT
jgi:hypothetical protein